MSSVFLLVILYLVDIGDLASLDRKSVDYARDNKILMSPISPPSSDSDDNFQSIANKKHRSYASLIFHNDAPVS